LKKTFILILVCLILSSTTAIAQKRRTTPKRSASASKAEAEKISIEKQTGRERVAAQIKLMTQFLYLLGGINKGIESVDQATRTREASPAAVELNDRNKAKVKESIKNVRDGLDKLESDIRSAPALKDYYSYVSGVAMIGETAESLAAANRFDEAGRTLLKAVNQLADALAAMGRIP
jgi:cell division protein FtsB